MWGPTPLSRNFRASSSRYPHTIPTAAVVGSCSQSRLQGLQGQPTSGNVWHISPRRHQALRHPVLRSSCPVLFLILASWIILPTVSMTPTEQIVHADGIHGSGDKPTLVKEELEYTKDAFTEGRKLIPRPTNDPNDPLNWTKFEKYSTYLTVCFFTILATMNSSNFTVAIKPISKEFHQTPTRTGYLVCFNVLLLGVGNLFWVALMRVIGKRPVYLAALLLLVAFNAWSYEAKTFNSLLASRILSGFASSAADATVPSLVADLFFAHERGHCMMIFHIALSTGFFLGPLICAYIVQDSGWRWTCGMLAIAAATTFVVGVFTIRESNYPRKNADVELPASAYPPRRGLLSWLSVTRGYNKNESFFRTLWRMLALVAYPPITWTGFTVGTFVGWNIVVQLTSGQTFTKPPYGWKVGSLGLLSISGFIGALLSFFVAGKLIDLIANRMTKARGKREPEYRLPAIIIPAFIGPMGILIFGLCVAHKTSWVGAAVGYCMNGFGITAAANVVVTYAVDGYQPLAGEALVVVFVIRNVIATILALYTLNWQAVTGQQNAFGEMVGIQYFFLLMSIPLYFYGKRIRHWTSTFGPMKEFPTDLE